MSAGSYFLSTCTLAYPALCYRQNRRIASGATSESTVPEKHEIIRTCMEAWTNDQQEYAAQVAETLEALESYEQHLQQWQTELAAESQRLTEHSSQLEEKRKQLAKQQAVDVAMTAELDQARAEIEDLRQRLADATDTIATARDQDVTDTSVALATKKKNSSVGVMDPTVSVVAKQFHKLRQQQAARRTGARSADER